MTQHALNEVLVILDDRELIWQFCQKGLNDFASGYLRLPSSVNLRGTWPRFRSAERIIVHWEGKRHGGAIVEEILDIAPLYPVDEKIIVLCENPTRSDVVYFGELGVTRVLRYQEHRRELLLLELKQLIGTNTPINKRERERRHLAVRIARFAGNDRDAYTRDQLWAQYEALIATGPLPDSPRFLELLAGLHMIDKNWVQAEDALNQAIEQNPGYLRAHRQLVRCLRRQGKFEQALYRIKKLQAQNRNHVSTWVDLGEIYWDTGDIEQAEACFNKALERDPTLGRALNGLAILKFQTGDLEGARQLLTKSSESLQVASKLNKQGVAMIRDGRFAQALDLYTRVQYVLPQQSKGAMLFYNMALCYVKWGRLDLAQEYQRISLIKDPEYDRAKRLLAKLGQSSSRAG